MDFISRKLKLVIEVDGYSHTFKYEKDRIKDEFLKNLGYRVIRFTDEEVQDIIETKKGKLAKEVLFANKIATKLRKKRFENGSFSFETEEVK